MDEAGQMLGSLFGLEAAAASLRAIDQGWSRIVGTAARPAWRSLRLSHTLFEFIDAFETRWKNQAGAPTAEQIGWLAWAKEIATTIALFSTG